jgi:hypothetical protein
MTRLPNSTYVSLTTFRPEAERAQTLAALRRTYGVRFQLGYVTSRLWHRVTRGSGERHEIIRIRPTR